MNKLREERLEFAKNNKELKESIAEFKDEIASLRELSTEQRAEIITLLDQLRTTIQELAGLRVERERLEGLVHDMQVVNGGARDILADVQALRDNHAREREEHLSELERIHELQVQAQARLLQMIDGLAGIQARAEQDRVQNREDVGAHVEHLAALIDTLREQIPPIQEVHRIGVAV